MFFLLPIQVKEPGGQDTIPLVNALLIVANVLVFFFTGEQSLYLAVGRGTGFWTILTYGFAHAGVSHLLANMWILYLIGNPVNRRLGNGYYLLAYFGSLVTLGMFAWLVLNHLLIGSSGAIFAVILIFLMLMPLALVRIGYVALFPITVLVGLFARPQHWVYWFIRWDTFTVRAWIGLVLVPFLELWGLWSVGWNWTNLAHLFGMLCGLVAVLLLPTTITMRRKAMPSAAY